MTAVLVAVVAFSPFAITAGAIELPAEINLGRLEPSRTVTTTITVGNPSAETVNLELEKTCPCVRVDPPRVEIASHSSAEVTIRFDPEGYFGEVRQTIFVRLAGSPEPAAAPAYRITVVADVASEPSTVGSDSPADASVNADDAACNDCLSELERLTGKTASTGAGSDPGTETTPRASEPVADSGDGPRGEVPALGHEPESLNLFLDIGCRSCIEFLELRLPAIERRFGANFNVQTHDIMDSDNMEDLLSRLSSRGIGLERFPIAFYHGNVFQGLDQIERAILEQLTGGAAAGSGSVSTIAGEKRGGAPTALTVPSVLLAGLIDGINPCAFSTILFLISMLALVGRSRREILIVGVVYTIVVFVGYGAVGLGLFASVRALVVFPQVAEVIQWILVGALLVLAALSIRDAWLAAKGRTRDMVLQLSDSMKRRVHSVVRERVRAASIVSGTVVLALLVTVFEFSCTGQIYLPVIVHLAQAETRAIGMLLLYNLAFIIPLIFVFAAAYSGVAMESVAAYFRRHLVAVKIALAAVFVVLAVATLVI